MGLFSKKDDSKKDTKGKDKKNSKGKKGQDEEMPEVNLTPEEKLEKLNTQMEDLRLQLQKKKSWCSKHGGFKMLIIFGVLAIIGLGATLFFLGKHNYNSGIAGETKLQKEKDVAAELAAKNALKVVVDKFSPQIAADIKQ